MKKAARNGGWNKPRVSSVRSPESAVGIDIWDFSLEAAIRGALPNTEFADGYQSVLMRAKEIKTQDEILCLKMANAFTEAALDRAIEALRPGIKECELLAIAWHTMTALGSEWTQCSNIITSGPNTAPYRRFTSDRIITQRRLSHH